MLVPRGVDDVDEPDAAFDQSSGQQAVDGKTMVGVTGLHGGSWPRGRAIDPVGSQGVTGLAREVRQFGCGRLHAEGEFVLCDAAGDFGVTDVAVTDGVEPAQGIQGATLTGAGDARRVGKVQDRVALATEGNTLVGGGQEAAGPVRGSSAGSSAGGQHDVAGQVVRFGSQPVGEPGTDRRAAHLGLAATEKQLAGVMVELFAVHGADQRDVVSPVTDLAENVRVLDATGGRREV